MSAVYTNELKHSQKNYPFAAFISLITVLLLFSLGTFGIAIVIPQEKISYMAGSMQALQAFLSSYHISWLTVCIAILMVIGSIANMNAWVIGPSKNLLMNAHDGNMPNWFKKTNKHFAPTTILFMQGIIISALSSLFLFLPTMNNSYWIFMDLTIVLYSIIYIFMFLAAIKIRYKYDNVHNSYKIPGGKAGVFLVAGIGITGCLLTLLISCIPPRTLHIKNIISYKTSLLITFAIIVSVALVLHKISHLSVNKNKPTNQILDFHNSN